MKQLALNQAVYPHCNQVIFKTTGWVDRVCQPPVLYQDSFLLPLIYIFWDSISLISFLNTWIDHLHNWGCWISISFAKVGRLLWCISLKLTLWHQLPHRSEHQHAADKGGDPEIIRESQRRRYADVGLVDRVLELDLEWRKARGSLDTLNMDFNKLTNEIKKLRVVSQSTTSINHCQSITNTRHILKQSFLSTSH